MEILGIFGGLLGLIMIIGVGIVIFLILRFFWLWYWKINNIVALLEDIDAKLLVLKNKYRIVGNPPVGLLSLVA